MVIIWIPYGYNIAISCYIYICIYHVDSYGYHMLIIWLLWDVQVYGGSYATGPKVLISVPGRFNRVWMGNQWWQGVPEFWDTHIVLLDVGAFLFENFEVSWGMDSCSVLCVCVYIYIYVCSRFLGFPSPPQPMVMVPPLPLWLSPVWVLSPRPSALWMWVFFWSSLPLWVEHLNRFE